MSQKSIRLLGCGLIVASNHLCTSTEILDQEVEKIVLFYLQQQGELAKRLSFMREKQVSNLQGSPVTLDELDSYLKNFRTLSQVIAECCLVLTILKYFQTDQEVLDLLEYLDLNVIGLRRILKKHDKQFDSKMSNMYFDSRLGNAQQHSQLVQLYHQEGLRAIIGTIRRGFEDIYEAKDALVVTLASPSAAHLTSGLTLFRGPSSGCGDRVSSSPMIAPLPRVPYTSRVASFSAMHLPSLVDGPTSGRTYITNAINHTNVCSSIYSLQSLFPFLAMAVVVVRCRRRQHHHNKWK